MKKSFDTKQYQKKSAREIKFSKKIIEHGAITYPAYLRSPYELYESFIKKNVNKKSKVVDLCCGNGKHTIISALCGGDVLGLDIVETSLDIAKQKAKLNGVINNTKFMLCDVNTFPIESNSADIITCLGSLSYLDFDKFLNEVDRVLKPKGKLIIVDSLDNNIIYKLNRFLQVLFFKRSFSTFNKMPSMKNLNQLKQKFPNSSFYFFNLFVWIAPIIKPFFRHDKLKKIMDFLDNKFNFFPNLAFKFLSISIKQ